MGPQASEQPMWDSVQDFIYPPEHDPEWMTRGPRSGRTSFTQQTDSQLPFNRLRDQIMDARLKVVEITGPAAPGDTAAPPCSTLQLPLAYKYPLLQPPTHWGYKLILAPRRRVYKWLEASGGTLHKLVFKGYGERVVCWSRSQSVGLLLVPRRVRYNFGRPHPRYFVSLDSWVTKCQVISLFSLRFLDCGW
jgi:hypothetical protein